MEEQAQKKADEKTKAICKKHGLKFQVYADMEGLFVCTICGKSSIAKKIKKMKNKTEVEILKEMKEYKTRFINSYSTNNRKWFLLGFTIGIGITVLMYTINN